MPNNPGRKHGQWRDNTTRVGKYIKQAMEVLGMEAQGIYGMLGLRYEQFATLMTSRNQKFYLPWIFRLATIPGISSIKLLMLLYGDQAIADDFTEEEQRMQMQLLLLFDRFYHLQDQDQDLAVKMMEDLLSNRGGRILSMEQRKFIDNMRISPSYGSGNGVRNMEDRIREYKPATGGTETGLTFLEGDSNSCGCPKCIDTTFYRDGKVKRKGKLVQRYKCKSCGYQTYGSLQTEPVVAE